MPASKHTPIRTCVACRTAAPKRGLMRVVRTPEGTVVVDPMGKMAGRGAYLCRNLSCVQAALKGKKLERSLKVALPAETAQVLLQMAAQAEKEVTRS
ncbi:MAG: YlxR family protein [Armatimonadota bacterium]|nr:YlxR family protein [bacterium]MCS7309505.1 YlxR family protein [Armatimonadota bacterium]MDW8103468.1 YlxR family protein [Armatimonadota bacterium]MDW8290052.1 YlxR family protein [Armatimonadota bacterium]